MAWEGRKAEDKTWWRGGVVAEEERLARHFKIKRQGKGRLELSKMVKSGSRVTGHTHALWRVGGGGSWVLDRWG